MRRIALPQDRLSTGVANEFIIEPLAARKIPASRIPQGLQNTRPSIVQPVRLANHQPVAGSLIYVADPFDPFIIITHDHQGPIIPYSCLDPAPMSSSAFGLVRKGFPAPGGFRILSSHFPPLPTPLLPTPRPLSLKTLDSRPGVSH